VDVRIAPGRRVRPAKGARNENIGQVSGYERSGVGLDELLAGFLGATATEQD
jgi:hypothetical protein